MKCSVKVLAFLVVVAVAGAAHAQTAIQPGQWEATDKGEIEGGGPMPPATKTVCLKGADATLERLLFLTPDKLKEAGCSAEPGPKKAGVLTSTLNCKSEERGDLTAKVEVNYTATSYEGVGRMDLKTKAGKLMKGTSFLTGKRLGDCS